MGYVILLWHSLSLSYNYFGTTTSKEKLVRMKSWIHWTFIIISDTILICLTSCFVLFCLLSVHSLLSFYHSLSICLFVCLPVLCDLHFGIDFGRNDPGPKRPSAESTHLPRPKRSTPKLGRNDPGRNDPGTKRPGFDPYCPRLVPHIRLLFHNLHVHVHADIPNVS